MVSAGEYWPSETFETRENGLPIDAIFLKGYNRKNKSNVEV